MAAPAPSTTPNPAHLNPIPKAVRQQMERAEAIQKQVYEGQGDVSPAPAADPLVAPAPAPAPTPAPAPAPDADARLRETQGRLDAERERNQRLQDQLNSTNAALADLQRTVAGLKAAPAPSPSNDLPKGKLVTEKEEEDYGKELLDVVSRRARDEVGGEISELKEEIKTLRGQVGRVDQFAAQTAEEKCLAFLADKIPDWAKQNEDPAFLRWLAQQDPFSGALRGNMLLDAFSRHDGKRVVAFFQGYRDEVAATSGTPQPAPTPAPGNGQPGKVPLETFAAPGKATPGAAPPPSPGQKPIYSSAQIAKFYADKNRGMYRGREADAAAIEADIFRAQIEGRVTP